MFPMSDAISRRYDTPRPMPINTQQPVTRSQPYLFSARMQQ